MGKFRAGLARFLAVIFTIVFVITAINAFLLVNIDRHLLNAATYINALARQRVYARLPRIIAEQLVTSITFNPCSANPLVCEGISPEFTNCTKAALGDARYNALSTNVGQFTDADKHLIQPCVDQYGSSLQSQQTGQNSSGGPPPFLQSLGVANLETIISSLMPPNDIQTMTEDTLTQVVAYLNGQQDTVTISLVTLKQLITSQSSINAIYEIIRAQPPCTLLQLERLTASFINGQPNIILCKPSEAALALMTRTIQDQLNAYARHIPDQEVIISSGSGINSAKPEPLGSGPIGGVRLAHLIMRLSPDLPLFCLLLISLLVVRAPKNWLRWWGIPFLITGLLSIGLAICASVFFERVWLVILARRIPPYLSLGVVTLGHDLARAIIQTFLGGLIVSGIIISLLGIGMWIGSTFIRLNNEVEPNSAPMPPA